MNTPLEVVGSTEESYSFTDDNGCPHPALVVRGCGCCSKHIPLTEENIDAAVAQAEAWIQYLRDLRPYQYPPEVDLDA